MADSSPKIMFNIISFLCINTYENQKEDSIDYTVISVCISAIVSVSENVRNAGGGE